HLGNSFYWFYRPKQHAPWYSIRQAGDIQAVMIAIDEIHVSVPWRSPEHSVSNCPPHCRVRRGIVRSQISFRFNNSPRQHPTRRLSNQQFPQQSARHSPGVAIEKFLLQPGDSTKWNHVPPISDDPKPDLKL